MNRTTELFYSLCVCGDPMNQVTSDVARAGMTTSADEGIDPFLSTSHKAT
jgi:hypothetical protein